ncbi:PAS domain-containing sensor histidine kinase [Pseudomonas koreensis]|uniref:PAS domain-containing sensor histidine kinase n=1 Tax=Pseudomonas koreensis TaxID=198620 RepID=UPI002FC9FD52
MTSGDKFLGRLLKRTTFAAHPLPDPLGSPASGLHLYLNDDGDVVQMAGPLRHLLVQHKPHDRPLPLSLYVKAHSTLAIEGRPKEWQGLLLDLDFPSLGEQTLHLRGWVQPLGEGWLLQLIDIGDLLLERQQARQRDDCQSIAARISEQVRACSQTRLPEIVGEQLQVIAQRWHIPCVALALLDDEEQGWQVYRQYRAHDAPNLWDDGQRLGTPLDSLSSAAPQRIGRQPGFDERSRVQALFGNAEGFAVPYSDERGGVAWLLCAFYPVETAAPYLSERDWTALLGALAGPLLGRLREHQHQLQLERVEVLQTLLGSGWWEILADRQRIQLPPTLAAALHLNIDEPALEDWLAQIHPADRDELRSRLHALQQHGEALTLSVRLAGSEPAQPATWYRVQGQVSGSGVNRRLVGFMLDISDIQNQQQRAAAAHARLDNLIASSPAVIYVQQYREGALIPTFFSASLQPLLGWSLADCSDGALIEMIHPDDHDLYFERTRQLLREGSVRGRYRLRDRDGSYHWLLDEARLLRDDLGLPVEAVGLWLDVTEATLAAERVKSSEERYRILVEDSPAMICRYRPDLILTFGNRPLATYLECWPEDLPGVDLGNWMSDEQRSAFVQRLAALTPEQPLSTAEISLQLPGREHAWWVWSDRGVFDEQGRLIEVQAVGRDNTELRRSQQQLTQSAKMATLGEMATGLAHEINQPLNVMRMAIVNVLKRLGNGDVQIDYLTDKLSRIDAQVQRAAKVVDHMRVFGRRSEIEQQLFNPAYAIEGTLSLLAEGMRGKGVDLRISETAFEVQVRGYVDQLEQVLINLMVNARDALLSRREKESAFKPWISMYVERDEQQVRLWVEDNGGGIDARLLERIFEPFFTTKPIGVGTGLGLSVSYGIIDNMGGRLSVRNSAEGARFCIELPIVSDA